MKTLMLMIKLGLFCRQTLTAPNKLHRSPRSSHVSIHAATLLPVPPIPSPVPPIPSHWLKGLPAAFKARGYVWVMGCSDEWLQNATKYISY